MSLKREIDFDTNATTQLHPAVWEAMQPWFLQWGGNPSSVHSRGRKAKQALEDARELIAELLDATPEDVLFTSGATEANNLAIFGLVPAQPRPIAISPLEHPCVIEPAQQLASRGYPLQRLNVLPTGHIADLSAQLNPDSCLVAIQAINHEVGTIQDIPRLVTEVKNLSPQAAFHCDAAQAAGKFPVSFRKWGVDSLSISGHKFRGPLGAGALVVSMKRKLRPLLLGGPQQQSRRAGTESVPLAVGLATALKLALQEREANWKLLSAGRERFWQGLQARCAPCIRNTPQDASPYVLNVSFPGCRADILLMKLDMLQLGCSTGSACSSGSLLPSPVLQAMGVPEEVLRSAIRFSWPGTVTQADWEEALERVVQAVAAVRT